MANLKGLRTRIASVKTTMQMTAAMKMVSAAKLRKAQNAIQQLRPYATSIHSLLVDMLGAADMVNNPLLENRNVKNVLIVPISSNRGLCGAFNANVEKLATDAIKVYREQGINADVFTIGKKIHEAMQRKHFNIVKEDNDVFDKINYDYASEISKFLVNDFTSKKYDRVEFIYHSFKSAGSYTLMKEQFLPIALPAVDKKKKRVDYIYEPNFKDVVDTLIPEALTMTVYKMILDTIASEHGARMTSMHKATENAKDMIYELTLNYNKARQASITNEIIEIVSGAEAQKG